MKILSFRTVWFETTSILPRKTSSNLVGSSKLVDICTAMWHASWHDQDCIIRWRWHDQDHPSLLDQDLIIWTTLQRVWRRKYAMAKKTGSKVEFVTSTQHVQDWHQGCKHNQVCWLGQDWQHEQHLQEFCGLSQIKPHLDSDSWSPCSGSPLLSSSWFCRFWPRS